MFYHSKRKVANTMRLLSIWIKYPPGFEYKKYVQCKKIFWLDLISIPKFSVYAPTNILKYEALLVPSIYVCTWVYERSCCVGTHMCADACACVCIHVTNRSPSCILFLRCHLIHWCFVVVVMCCFIFFFLGKVFHWPETYWLSKAGCPVSAKYLLISTSLISTVFYVGSGDQTYALIHGQQALQEVDQLPGSLCIFEWMITSTYFRRRKEIKRKYKKTKLTEIIWESSWGCLIWHWWGERAVIWIAF